MVPAFNEESQIERTILTMPALVDWLIIVDDGSQDATAQIVARMTEASPRIVFLRHAENRGVGGAISTGYIWCRDNDVDIAVVMAGDGQMDPADLPALLDPVVEGRADYAKGNRLVTDEAWNKIPKSRYLGNSALTLLTKIASGYWHVTDSQSGYTALHKEALRLLPLESIFPRYGMPNDFLVTLNIHNMVVVDVPVAPVYRIGERSGIRWPKVMLPLFLLLVRLFFRRMTQKYIIRDFHPLIFFYALALMLFTVDLPLGVRFFALWIKNGFVPEITLLAILFTTVLGFQSVLFAMLFDMEANRDLKGSPSARHANSGVLPHAASQKNADVA